MSFEPINIFSCRIDPRGVAELLRRCGEAKVSGPDDDWEEIVVTLRKGSWFRKAQALTIGHNSEYYDGGDWPRQVLGMQGYFSRFPDTPRKSEVLRAIGSFRFALSVPQHDLNVESADERLKIVYAVCQHLDGVIFTASALRDAQGRLLYSADGQYDPEAILPRTPHRDSEDADAESPDVEDNVEPKPQTRERVTRRALALTAVAARATLEIDASQLDNADEQRERILHWIDELGIGDELEPDEWKVLQRPVGKLDERLHTNAMWRVEGLVVLAWALQRFEMPPDDELVVPMEVYRSVGLLNVDVAREILAEATLRCDEELEAMQTHLLMLHWRLRNYSLQPEAMDFAAFSQHCWIGSFDIDTFRLIDNDLAIGEQAIHDAPDDQVRLSNSIAMERHLAINWLAGDSEIYSETDTST
jgi:hypothetical protein